MASSNRPSQQSLRINTSIPCGNNCEPNYAAFPDLNVLKPLLCLHHPAFIAKIIYQYVTSDNSMITTCCKHFVEHLEDTLSMPIHAVPPHQDVIAARIGNDMEPPPVRSWAPRSHFVEHLLGSPDLPTTEEQAQQCSQCIRAGRIPGSAYPRENVERLAGHASVTAGGDRKGEVAAVVGVPVRVQGEEQLDGVVGEHLAN
uniref:Uncharacterized protein n=1 Tax=Oryza brachyantha TaxID=4533 RepID=J3N0W9_ORYBR